MVVKFTGFETIDYVNKSGAQVKGVRGYYVEEIRNGIGKKTNGVFFHPERFNLPALPKVGEYDLEWGCTAGGNAYIIGLKVHE